MARKNKIETVGNFIAWSIGLFFFVTLSLIAYFYFLDMLRPSYIVKTIDYMGFTALVLPVLVIGSIMVKSLTVRR